MNVQMTISQTAMLLGGVMLAVVASMTPGGIGVSELGSRGILVWLGMEQSQAETVAIALRMLTPLFGIAGIACALPLLRQKFAKRLVSAG